MLFLTYFKPKNRISPITTRPISKSKIVLLFILAFLCVVILTYLFQFVSVYYNHQYNFSKYLYKNLELESNYTIENVIYYHNLDSVTDKENCEVVHIGIVAAGIATNIFFHVLLKSIYFYRNNPLHFHILASDMSQNTIYTLFNTWSVPQVNITLYNTSEFILDINWLESHHYSGVYGLLKLMIPKAVPNHVTQIIILDTDIVLNGDIAELWSLFKYFNAQQVLGLVENQSDFYLTKSITRWPAIGRGYNTGVMLYNIERMRSIGWNNVWRNIANKTAVLYGSMSLADQDVINAVITEHPEMLFKVPCSWNVQLSDHTLSFNCYRANPIKAIHWNSPRKVNVVNRHSSYFRNVYTRFAELNGNLLRTVLRDCTNSVISEEETYSDKCFEFHQATTNKWRTFLFFRKFDYIPLKYDVTFVAQFSFDRLQLLEELCKHWQGILALLESSKENIGSESDHCFMYFGTIVSTLIGGSVEPRLSVVDGAIGPNIRPMSLTLYATDPEFQEIITFLDNMVILKTRTNIGFHVVFKSGEYYPINLLRNVGLEHINTPYVFLADIDFLPMENLYVILREYLAKTRNMKKKALIIPAFETQKYRNNIPRNKTELLQMWAKKRIFTFRYDVWASGHAPTNYSKWQIAKAPYQVKWEPDFEPYIVVRSDVPKYDVRFIGFGWNKVSHIMELEAAGYDFIVLPDVFIMHKPHAPSNDILRFRRSATYRMCLQNLKENFVSMLQAKYNRNFGNKSILLNEFE